MATGAAPPLHYQAIFASTASAYLILDTQLIIVEVNDAYLRATARARESLLGKHVFDAFPGNPDDPGAVEIKRLNESFQRVIQTRTVDEVGVLQYDIPIGDPGSGRFEHRYWSPINSPVLDHEGALTHILHQAIDVTVRIASEMALRTSEHRLRALTSATGDVIYRMSADWAYLHDLDGRGFLKDTGSIGVWHIEDYVPPENVDAVRRAIDDAIRTKSTFDIEHPVVRSDGGRGWTASRAVPILDARGNIVEWIGSASDISARKLAEKQLQEASRRKDEFLAMLAHELRNPLAPIAAAADLLRLGAHDEARVTKASDIIGRQVRHLTGLVDELLDVARVTRGHVELECAPLDMRSIMQAAVEQVRPLVEGRRHRLSLQTTPDAATVNGDATRLTQVITNLLTNAAKYTPAQGEISVSLYQDDTEVRVTVRDNGIGMSPELINCCFDMFVQAERSSERAAGGLGIGLALVKSLVELHGGRVSVTSEGEGHGSTLTLTLPRTSTTDPVGATTPGTLTPAASPLRVLVVDDNADAAEMLAMLIGDLGYDTEVETNSRKALERIVHERFDVCLVDVGMPDIDGHGIARAVRSRADNAPVLVAITGYSQPQDRSAALDAGFTEHFAKPVDITKLALLLSRLSPRSQA